MASHILRRCASRPRFPSKRGPHPSNITDPGVASAPPTCYRENPNCQNSDAAEALRAQCAFSHKCIHISRPDIMRNTSDPSDSAVVASDISRRCALGTLLFVKTGRKTSIPRSLMFPPLPTAGIASNLEWESQVSTQQKAPNLRHAHALEKKHAPGDAQLVHPVQPVPPHCEYKGAGLEAVSS
jgi:hypothetical protein